jgi:hypothetical protein
MQNLPMGWIILTISLGVLGYTAWVVWREKSVALNNSVKHQLHRLNFSVPSWWSIKDSAQDYLQFHRADTRYDWTCHIERLSSVIELKNGEDLAEIFRHHMELQKVQFDVEEFSLFIDDKSSPWIVRAEGTATENFSNRLYLEVALLYSVDQKDLYYLHSKSSVLSGSVEGPYFQTLLENIILA